VNFLFSDVRTTLFSSSIQKFVNVLRIIKETPFS
jgi:hypothetical protein